jgi:hypothetical protein
VLEVDTTHLSKSGSPFIARSTRSIRFTARRRSPSRGGAGGSRRCSSPSACGSDSGRPSRAVSPSLRERGRRGIATDRDAHVSVQSVRVDRHDLSKRAAGLGLGLDRHRCASLLGCSAGGGTLAAERPIRWIAGRKRLSEHLVDPGFVESAVSRLHRRARHECEHATVLRARCMTPPDASLGTAGVFSVG